MGTGYRMTSIYDIYERKNYRNTIPLAQSVSFEIEVRETNLYIQAQSDLTPRAKDSVFRYRYQIEEYLRQHPAFREAAGPIQIYASAPEIIRYTDLASRVTGVPPMWCMSGAIADFVCRDLANESPEVIVSSGGDSAIRSPNALKVKLYAQGSPLDGRLKMTLHGLKKPFGISTYVPKQGAHCVTVLSRSSAWASAFSTDLGLRLASGKSLEAALDRCADYRDVGGVVVVNDSTLVVLGDITVIAEEERGAQA